jgi:hypothetical protein
MNRTGDPGWGNVFAAVNCYGGLHVVPESDTITGGVHYGFHTQFAFAAVQSSNVNNIGYKPQTYNAFIAYPNAIAPGGDVVYAGGDTTGTTASYPYSPLRIDKNFLHGIITDPTFHANDGAIIHTQPGNGVVWDDGTGTASITGTEVSAGVVNVTIANAGTARLIVSNAAVTSSVGFACGASYATFLSDFTKHISLYDDHGGNKAGLSVTSSDFSNNYVALGTGYHNFYIGGTLAAQIGPSAVTGSVGLQIGGWTGPTWTTGSGVPSSTQPVGSLYSRVSTWAAGATLYVSKGAGAWTAVASV